MPPVHRWPCTVERAYDGDTLTVLIDRGFREYKRLTVRLIGIDTPEIRKAAGVPDDEVDLFKRAGKLARDEALLKVEDAESAEWESSKLDKYGRSLGRLWLCPPGVSPTPYTLNSWLLLQWLAVPYDGGARDTVEHIAAHRRNIEQLVQMGRL